MKINFPKLNFPCYEFRLSKRDDVISIWDPIRRSWLVLTPEEWVRQHVIRYLIEECEAHQGCIAQEVKVTIGGMPQRADIVLYNSSAEPYLLVECKAPEVVVDSSTLAQAVRYNALLGARYVLLTNGLKHYCYNIVGQDYVAMPAIPSFAGI